MTKTLYLGEFELRTDPFSGDKIRVKHIPTGNTTYITSEGGFAPETYGESSLPTPQDHSGVVYHDTDRGVNAWYDGDHYEFPTFADNRDVETSTVVVSNTTDESEIFRFGANNASLIKGRLFILRVFGKFNTEASSDNFTYRAYVGDKDFDPISGEGTVITNVSTVQENVTDGPWQMKTTSTVNSEGATAGLQTHAEGSFNNTKKDDHKSPATIDTTTGTVDWVGTVEWNEAKAGNSVTRGQAYLQQQA